MTPADKPLPGADLQPTENPPAAPEQHPPLVPEEDNPEVKDTEVQPT